MKPVMSKKQEKERLEKKFKKEEPYVFFIKQREIQDIISNSEEGFELYSKSIKNAFERINKLEKSNFYIESLLVHAQLIEHGLKLLFNVYLRHSKILRILDIQSPFMIDTVNIKNTETLGELITQVKILFGSSSSLFEKLQRLNGLRREIAHHVFDGHKDIEEMEKLLKDYLKDDVYKIYDEIQERISPKQEHLSEILEILKAHSSILRNNYLQDIEKS